MDMSRDRRLVLLVQLPVPPPGLEPVRGNVPLAAGYLKLHAIRQSHGRTCQIDILPPDPLPPPGPKPFFSILDGLSEGA